MTLSVSPVHVSFTSYLPLIKIVVFRRRGPSSITRSTETRGGSRRSYCPRTIYGYLRKRDVVRVGPGPTVFRHRLRPHECRHLYQGVPLLPVHLAVQGVTAHPEFLPLLSLDLFVLLLPHEGPRPVPFLSLSTQSLVRMGSLRTEVGNLVFIRSPLKSFPDRDDRCSVPGPGSSSRLLTSLGLYGSPPLLPDRL